MSGPTLHSHALGIHPGAYVQNTAPNTTAVQDHVLWVDTSNAPRLQLNVWDATTATWQPVAAAPGATVFETNALLRPYPGQPGWLWLDIGNPVWSEDEQGYNFVLKFWDDDAYEWVSAVTPHRNVYLQDTAPPQFNSGHTLVLLGRGDLWIDSSTGPPYALNIWNDRGTPAWQAVIPWPYATLTTPPSTLVGQDPATGLPAFCPAPLQPVTPVVVPSPTPPVVPPASGDPCVQTRCGAAVALQTKLVSDYNNWRQWINAAVSFAVGGLIAAVLAEIAAVLAVAEVAAWVLQVFKLVSPIIGASTVTALPSLIPPLSGPQVDQILHRFFCELQCTSSVVALTQTEQHSVSAAILADTTTFPSDLMRELLGEIVYYDPLQDWQAAMSNAPVSDLCDGMTCP